MTLCVGEERVCEQETNSQPSQLAFHLMTSHLLLYPHASIAFIDTTGTFSPIRLRDIIVRRLAALSPSSSNRPTYRERGYVYEKVDGGERHDEAEGVEALRAKAAVMLDRIKVMRVFDFAGVVEAVGEVGEMCEGYEKAREEASRVDRRSQPAGASEGDGKARREEVGDSEDDDHDNNHNKINELDTCVAKPEHTPDLARGTSIDDTDKIRMLVIDNIATVVSPMMARNQTEGTPPLPFLSPLSSPLLSSPTPPLTPNHHNEQTTH